MAFSLTVPHSTAEWVHLPSQVRTSIHDSRVAHRSERRMARPELTPEERAHRLRMERLELQRSSAAIGASGWPR